MGRWPPKWYNIACTTNQYYHRGVPTFAKAHFGHPSPSSRQKLNGTDYNLRCPDLVRDSDRAGCFLEASFCVEKIQGIPTSRQAI
jgi:hypothetical protein